jgi:hypothetical protein
VKIAGMQKLSGDSVPLGTVKSEHGHVGFLVGEVAFLKLESGEAAALAPAAIQPNSSLNKSVP